MKIIHCSIIAFILVITVGLLGLAVAQSPYITAKVYMASDGDSLYVQSGGVANVTSGGKLNLASGSTFGNAATQTLSGTSTVTGTLTVSSGSFLIGSRKIALDTYRGKPAAESLDVRVVGLDATDLCIAQIYKYDAIGDSTAVIRATRARADTLKIYFSKKAADSLNVVIQSWQD
jgi:hypothetical protein